MNARQGRLFASEEGDSRGLRLGREQGEAFGRTLRHMIEEVADSGREIEIGDYLVGFAAEKAEGVYVPREGEMFWQEPKNENVHIEISVRDRADGRFIPGLNVEVAVIDADGRTLGTHRHPMLWHPYLYHYGRNWQLPAEGRYSLRVRFDPPDFPRHDKRNGNRLAQGADVTFQDVPLRLGKG